MQAKASIYDLARFRAQELHDLPPGSIFLYSGILAIRFTLNGTECWAPLEGERAFLVHDYKNKRASVATLQADNLEMRLSLLSPLLDRNDVSSPFGHALVLPAGIGFGASGINDRPDNEAGRMAILPACPNADFHERGFSCAVERWELQWLDRFESVVASIRRDED